MPSARRCLRRGLQPLAAVWTFAATACLCLFCWCLSAEASSRTVVSSISSSSGLRSCTSDQVFCDLADLVLPYGYPLQQQFATTGDGYLLRLLRMPYGTNGPRPTETRPVVFLQHGLLDSAAGFLLNGPNKSLAFVLVDQGYDVWLGNVRGNTLSRTHTHLTIDDPEFWMFSYDEMARHDIPTMIRHVMQATGCTRLSYIGHSQGTLVILAALSTHPWLNQVLDLTVLLAPIAVAKHIGSVPLLALSALNTDAIFTLLGINEFLPSSKIVSMLEGQLCMFQPQLCVSFLAAICGYNPSNLDNSRLPIYLSYTPAGTSVQNMAHWSQAVKSRAPNTMSYFDYGTNCATPEELPRCNQMAYGAAAPPLYNLTAITAKLALFRGGQDILASPMNTEYLLESLAPGVVVYNQYEDNYEHLDFIWGINAREIIYDKAVHLLKLHGQG